MNYYEVLGLRVGASPFEVDLAYKTIRANAQDIDTEMDVELSVAYNTLINPTLRHEYNTSLTDERTPTPVLNQTQQPFLIIKEQEQKSNIEGILLAWMMGFMVVICIGAFALM